MNRKLGTPALLIVLFLQSVFISGCWDSKEVEELAIVTLLGIDRITENGVDQWQFSARIMSTKGQEGQQGEGQSQQKRTEVLMQGTGLTVQDAVTDLAKRMPRRPLYGQIAAVIIGERVAKEKLPDVMELENRFPETRPRTQFLVTKGEAFAALQTEPELASVLSKEVQGMSQEKAQMNGVSYGVTSSQLLGWLLSPDRDAVLPELKLFYPEKGEKTVPESSIVEGLGVFRGAKLVGWLTREETEGYLLVNKKIRKAQMHIVVTRDNKLLSYSLSNAKAKIEPNMDEGKLSFVIKIKTQGIIYENDGLTLNAEEIPALEESIGEKIGELALGTVAKAKEYDADFLGLMQALHRQRPDLWRDVEANWREAFAQAEVEVEVEAKVVNVGKMGESLEFKE